MKKKIGINGIAFIYLLFLYTIINITASVQAVDTSIEGVTKGGGFACKSKELMSDAHFAFRSMEFEKFKDHINSGNCWMLEANIKLKVIGNADWGRPVEVIVDGKRFWTMQHMIQYSPEKEKENELARLYFAGGVGINCGWASPNVMMFKIMRIGDYGIEKMGIHSDRVYELQKMHLRDGKADAQKYGCNHPYIQMIKKDYGKYFIESEDRKK